MYQMYTLARSDPEYRLSTDDHLLKTYQMPHQLHYATLDTNNISNGFGQVQLDWQR